MEIYREPQNDDDSGVYTVEFETHTEYFGSANPYESGERVEIDGYTVRDENDNIVDLTLTAAEMDRACEQVSL